jgi:hypothetical protein
MTLPDADPPRKPHRRRWLFAPYILLLIVIIGWSAGWVFLRMSAAREMDQTAERLRAAGYQVSWASRDVGGYPFRLNTRLTEVRIGEPSGWAITAPEIKSEAAVYALGRWTAAAPQGVTLLRPNGGPVTIRGQALRASLSDIGRRPPHLIVEGLKLTFTPQPGDTYPFTSADRVVVDLRPGPDDQAALLMKIDNAGARLTGLLGRVAQDRPVSINWESTLDKMSAFKGDTWPAAVQAWTASGGTLTVRTAGMTAGEAVISAKSGALTVGPDGRLRGALQAELREVPPSVADIAPGGSVDPAAVLAAAAAAMAQRAGGGVAQAGVTFDDGQTFLGPLPVGPAPRIY